MLLNIIPAINFGYAKQAEAIQILYCLGQAFYGALFCYRNCVEALLPFAREPLGISLLALSCLSGLLAAFHPSPVMDFLGSVQMGEGSFLFLAAFFHYVQLRRVHDVPLFMAIVAGWALFFAGLLIAGNNEPLFLWNQNLGFLIKLTPYDHAARWTPYWFPDPAAFLILPLIVLFLFKRQHMNWGLQAVCGVVLIVMTLFSCNSVLKYGLLLAALATFIVYKWPRLFKRQHIPLLFIVATALIAILAYYADVTDFLPANITQRALLLKVITAHYTQAFGLSEMLEVFVGRGWGSFNAFLTENVYLLDVSAYTGSKVQLSWESLIRDQFHSHNVVFEYYLSMGIIGLLALAYLSYHVIQDVRREHFYLGLFFLTTLALLSSFWFQNTASLPFSLFILVLLLQHQPLSSPLIHKLSIYMTKLVPLGITLMITGASLQGYVSEYIRTNHGGKSQKTLVQDLEHYSQTWQAQFDKYQDFYRTNNFCLYHMAAIDKILTQKGAKTKKIYALHKRLARFLSDNVGGKTLGASRITIANLLGTITLNPVLKKYASDDDYRLWEESVADIMKFLPYRGDMAVPLLSSYLTAGKTEQALTLIETMRMRHPENPAALWFRGLILMQDDQTAQEGLANAYKALEGGLNRFMPIDEQQAARIRALYHSLRP